MENLVHVVADPHVRQVGAGDGGGLVVKLRVPCRLRSFRSIRNDRGSLIELTEVDAVGVELVVREFHHGDQGFALIKAEKAQQHDIKRACEMLKVSRSACYEARKGSPSRHEAQDAELAAQAEPVHE